MLDVAGRAVVVIGGGAVALRRADSLRCCDAEVTLVAPDISGDPPENVTVLRESYSCELLSGAFLVFACSDDAELNSQIARDARQVGALVNVADQPADCDFFMPAVVTDGDVTVAISTAGAAPALAGNLKRKLARAIPSRIGEFAALLAQIRNELKTTQPNSKKRMDIMKKLSDDETHKLFITKGPAAVREKLKNDERQATGNRE